PAGRHATSARLGADYRDRQYYRSIRRDRRRRDLARAGRSVRTLRRAGGECASDLLRDHGTSCAGGGNSASARYWLPRTWRYTDAERTGMLPWAFEPGMGFERYVDYALDVPMYFVKRGEQYIDVAGQSFRALMQGRLQILPGERATMSDWANHVSTIFPEVRLKRYLEMRGADGGPWRRLP